MARAWAGSDIGSCPAWTCLVSKRQPAGLVGEGIGSALWGAAWAGVGCWSVMRAPWWFPVTGGDVSVTNGACLAPAVAARWWAAAWGPLRPASELARQQGGEESWH